MLKIFFEKMLQKNLTFSMSEFFVIIYLSFQSLYGMFLKEGFYENGKNHVRRLYYSLY